MSYQEEYAYAYNLLLRWFQSGHPNDIELALQVMLAAWVSGGRVSEVLIDELRRHELLYSDDSLKAGTRDAGIELVKQLYSVSMHIPFLS